MFIKLLLNFRRSPIKIRRSGGQEHSTAIMVARGTPMTSLISPFSIAYKYYKRAIKFDLHIFKINRTGGQEHPQARMVGMSTPMPFLINLIKS